MRIVVLTALVCCSGALGNEPAVPVAATQDTFDRMKALSGDWEANLAGYGKITNSIHLVSGGKAIEETIGTPAENEVSIYMRDGKRILLTHFCALTPEGHQVRLETSGTPGASKLIEFQLVGSTNLPSAAAPHMRLVEWKLEGPDRFSERWIESEGGKDTVFEFHFTKR